MEVTLIVTTIAWFNEGNDKWCHFFGGGGSKGVRRFKPSKISKRMFWWALQHKQLIFRKKSWCQLPIWTMHWIWIVRPWWRSFLNVIIERPRIANNNNNEDADMGVVVGSAVLCILAAASPTTIYLFCHSWGWAESNLGNLHRFECSTSLEIWSLVM